MTGQYIEAMPAPSLLDSLAAPLRALPSQWAVCRGWARQRLCNACIRRFAAQRPRCDRCAIGVPDGVAVCGACLKRPPPFKRAVAAVDYDHPWDELVQRFKFDAALDLAEALAQRLLDAVGHADATLPAWLLPVPLGAARLRERGYSRAWELASRVARHLPCTGDPRLPLRLKDTPHQLALPPAQRAANVRGVVAVEPGAGTNCWAGGLPCSTT